MRVYTLYIFIVLTLALSGCSQKKNKEITKIDQPEVSRLDSMVPPKPIGWVADYEGILTSSQVMYLDSLISDHEKKTSNEVAIVTMVLDSTQIVSDEDLNEISLSLFNKWRFGKEDKNNGIGMLVSTNLKKTRIEVGRGLETKLANHEAKDIIEINMIPEFRKGDYYTGILNGLLAIFREIK
ncbi:MAG: TPM domain-containing protein [Chitinophagaceae bacterium]